MATGEYKGKPASPDTVKFRTKFQDIEVAVDRPRGFVMRGQDERGRAWSREYLYDYGFIPKTQGGDGDGIDVFLGPSEESKTAYWAIQRRPEGGFDEYKVMLGFPSREAAIEAYARHIPSRLMVGMIGMSLEMMRAMLGKNPAQSIKTAQAFIKHFWSV